MGFINQLITGGPHLVEHVDFIQTTKSYCWHQNQCPSLYMILKYSKYLPNEPPWFRISAHSWKGINDIYWGDIAWGIIPKASKSHQSYLEVSEAMGGTSKSAIYSLDWFSGQFSPDTMVFTRFLPFNIGISGEKKSLKPIQWFTHRIFMDFPWHHPAIWDPWNSPHERA